MCEVTRIGFCFKDDSRSMQLGSYFRRFAHCFYWYNNTVFTEAIAEIWETSLNWSYNQTGCNQANSLAILFTTLFRDKKENSPFRTTASMVGQP